MALLPGMGLAMLAFLDLAVRKRLLCLLGPPRRAPRPPVPMDLMEAKAVSLNVLQAHAHSKVLTDGLLGCSQSTGCRCHGFKHKETDWLIAF